MSGQPLTSLRNTPSFVPEQFPHQSPQEIARNRLMAIKAEIGLLEKRRDELQEEVNQALSTSQEVKKRLASEISSLSRKRNSLGNIDKFL